MQKAHNEKAVFPNKQKVSVTYGKSQSQVKKKKERKSKLKGVSSKLAIKGKKRIKQKKKRGRHVVRGGFEEAS